MVTNPQVQTTDFTRDVLGRYICNGLDEAIASTRSGASPFHYIILGGGTFGGTLASFLADLDPPQTAFNDPFKRYHSRILVLEAGPLLLPEHEQNLPGIGVGVPGPSSIAEIQPDPSSRQKPAPPRNEVWGIPWHSPDGFNGLAYCLGGRSIFWGGWAPRFLRTEMPTTGPSPALWPKRVVHDLHADGDRLWNDAAHQIGADDPNDFVNGELHTKLRQVFFDAVIGKKIRHMISVGELPEYLDEDKRKMRANGNGTPREAYKLDAPYAVQSSTRSGFFPFNKFSSVPLMIGAARDAAKASQKTADIQLNDSRRQVMIVPNCHVTSLRTLPVSGERGDLRRVVAIETNRGTIEVAHNAVVIFALSAIEDARLALHSFGGARAFEHIGKNLMVHLRSNTQFRVPRTLPLFKGFKWDQLEVSAIQLRGRVTHPDGTHGHFHLQIAASGVRAGADNADVEIFQKIPDLDQFEFFRTMRDDEVAFAVRGIGEFSPKNPASRVELDAERDEFGVPRAFVRINDDGNSNTPGIRALNEKDSRVLNAMVEATNDVLQLFGLPARPVRSEPPENPGEKIDEGVHIKLDGVGTTYHEAGTLRMGDDPEDSAVDADLRFHGVTNAYVSDMAVLPTCGSANPVQPGVALARRLAQHLTRPAVNTIPPEGMYLFKDTPTPFWRLAGAPASSVTFGLGEIEVRSSGGPFGLYWCMIPTPPDFELTLEWLSTDVEDNSGVFIRFPDPDRAPPGKDQVFLEPGFTAAEYGFEIQIDRSEGGDNPKDALGNTTENVLPRFRGTGAIYNESRQDLRDIPVLEINKWHKFVIRARGMRIEVDVGVDGAPPVRRTTFDFNPANYAAGDLRGDKARGLPTATATNGGANNAVRRYIGLQTHARSKLIKFRNIFIRPL